MFIDETAFHSKTQKALYEEQWRSPNAPEDDGLTESEDDLFDDSNYDDDDQEDTGAGLVSGGDDMDSDGKTDGLTDALGRNSQEDEVLAWWVILLIVVAGVVLLAAVVICIVK